MNAQKVIKDVFERGVKEGVFFESQAHQFRSAVSNIFVKLAETKEVPLEYIGQDASSRKYVYQVKCDSAHAKLYESPFTVHLPEPTDAAFKMTMSEHSVWQSPECQHLLLNVSSWLHCSEDSIVSYFDYPEIGIIPKEVYVQRGIGFPFPHGRLWHVVLGTETDSINCLLHYSASEEILWINETDVTRLEKYLARN